MIRYCLKPRTKAAIERAAAKIASSGTVARFERVGATWEGEAVTPKWAHGYLALPCVKSMTPAQASRDLAAHLKRWREEKDWGRGPGALALRWKGNADTWEG